MQICVDGQVVTHELRTAEISRTASVVSAMPAVREWLLPVQRDLGAGGGVVMEGRDIGTRIFPEAEIKFFLDADSRVRASRRHLELTAAGHAAALDRTHQEIEARDMRDRSREASPLAPAGDAHIIDTSALEAVQVVDRMLAIIASRR